MVKVNFVYSGKKENLKKQKSIQERQILNSEKSLDHTAKDYHNENRQVHHWYKGGIFMQRKKIIIALAALGCVAVLGVGGYGILSQTTDTTSKSASRGRKRSGRS